MYNNKVLKGKKLMQVVGETDQSTL